MIWIELKLEATLGDGQAISALLETHGASAVTLEDAGNQPIYEPEADSLPTWHLTRITGLFTDKATAKAAKALIQAAFPGIRAKLSVLRDQDWQNLWRQDFHPMQFGERLWVVPSDDSETHSLAQVVLDPGLAFGTGKHPTTALCLTWLDKHIKGQEVLIDYGCGSGILGIAAIKLGASRVYAVDNDPQALIATQENAAKNAIPAELLITLAPGELHHSADILIANILANPLIELAKIFANYVAPAGHIVLSGILSSQKAEVIHAYQPWFKIQTIDQAEDWLLITGQR